MLVCVCGEREERKGKREKEKKACGLNDKSKRDVCLSVTLFSQDWTGVVWHNRSLSERECSMQMKCVWDDNTG